MLTSVTVSNHKSYLNVQNIFEIIGEGFSGFRKDILKF